MTVLMTALCSTGDVIKRVGLACWLASQAAPRIAKLSLSEPQLVKTISDGWQLRIWATRARASSIAFSPRRPWLWLEVELP